MEEIIGILLAILVFGGPFLFKILAALFEGVTSSPSNSTPQSTSSSRSEFAEKLMQHRKQKLMEAQAVEAEIIDDPKPHSLARSESDSQDAYYNQSQHLADSIQTRDDQMDSHLHEVFDHSLGSIGGTPLIQVQENVLGTEQEGGAKEQSLAASIAAMMSEPASIRKAFILGEILQRPAGIDRG